MASPALIADVPPRGVRAIYLRLRGGDDVAYLITLAAAATILVLVALLVLELSVNSQPTVKAFGFSFLTSSRWDPNSGHFGALAFVYGPRVTSFLALLLAIPLGVAASIFLAEMAPPQLSNILTFLI